MTIFGLDSGDAATWFSGIAAVAVFGFTLFVWRTERHEGKEREVANAETELRKQAARVGAWMERYNSATRATANHVGQNPQERSWVVCISNQADFPIYQWRVDAQFESPRTSISADAKQYGPLAPLGGTIVIPVAGASRDGTAPKPSIDLEFNDELGIRWRRSSGSGLHRA